MIMKTLIAGIVLGMLLVSKQATANWLSPWQLQGVQWDNAQQQEHNGITIRYANFEANMPVMALGSRFSQAAPGVFQRLLTLPRQVILSGIATDGEHWLAVIHQWGQGATGYLSVMSAGRQNTRQSPAVSVGNWWQPRGIKPVLAQSSNVLSSPRYQQLFRLPHCTGRSYRDVSKQLETRGWHMLTDLSHTPAIQVWQRHAHQVTLIPVTLTHGCGLYVVQQQGRQP